MRQYLVAVMAVLASAASAGELRLIAAGSLKEPLTTIFADYGKSNGTTFAAEWGPSGLLRDRLKAGEAFDIFASAALPHAQALTDAGLSGPSVMFVRNALCVVTHADSPLETANLVETLLKPEIRIGTSTPGADPSGDYTWELFHKVDGVRPGAFDILAKKAQQLFGGPTNSAPVNGRSPALVALDAGRIDLFISYCSGAQQAAKEGSTYKSVALPPELMVGAEYGLTVSRKAQPAAADFALYLLSPRGQRSLQAFGLMPVALPAAP
jgi:molybdate transport system substrate-binding protein